MSNKIISGDSVSDVQRWALPMVEDVSSQISAIKKDRIPPLLTAEKIEKIQAQAHQEAYDAGFIKGRREGLKSGQDEAVRKARLLDDLLNGLARPLAQLDESVEVELVGLAIAVAKHLVRRELKTDPGEIVAVIHEALAVLPLATRNIRVLLHPEDAVLVRELIAQSGNDRHWIVAEDPSLHRGDCRVVTDTSQIDATLERRLAAVVAQILGGERQQDVTPPGR